jgi:hypothetical protein
MDKSETRKVGEGTVSNTLMRVFRNRFNRDFVAWIDF